MVWAPALAVDGVEFILGVGVLHVAVVAEVEHVLGVPLQLQPLVLGKTPIFPLHLVRRRAEDVEGTFGSVGTL